jgi:putative ABC transport system ATP-binding protein
MRTVPAVDIVDLSFSWTGSEPVLRIGCFTLGARERVFVHGASGSGKSTLLGLIGGVQLPDAGQLRVLGEPLPQLRGARRDAFRADRIGFIFQMFNLLPFLSILDNVALPCRFSPRRRSVAIERSGSVAEEARRLLARLGLSDESMLARRVDRLSIGQQQRVAAARALIGAPELVIADEPTSALDADARQDFIELLLSECDQARAAVMFVSHDRALGARFDRAVAISELNG